MLIRIRSIFLSMQLSTMWLRDANLHTCEMFRDKDVKLTAALLMLHCRLRELHTLKGHVESVVKLKGLDIETIQQSYTV